MKKPETEEVVLKARDLMHEAIEKVRLAEMLIILNGSTMPEIYFRNAMEGLREGHKDLDRWWTGEKKKNEAMAKIEKHMLLERRLKALREKDPRDEHQEDNILDEMEAIHYKMSKGERALLEEKRKVNV